MAGKALKLLRRYPKTLLLLSFIILYFYVLPELAVQASLLYFKDWQTHAQSSAAQITQGQPYCIAVPLIRRQTGHLLYTPKTFNELDIERVIRNEVEWKFRYFEFDLGDSSWTLRVRKDHFGIVFNKKLYYWSFVKEGFFDARANSYADSTHEMLTRKKNKIELGRKANALPPATFKSLNQQNHNHNYSSRVATSSSASAVQQKPENLRSLWYAKQSYQQFQHYLQQHYPNLTPDDFICEHLQ